MKKLLPTLSVALLLGISDLCAQNFQWARQTGGGSNDFSKDVTLDASGNLFHTGTFSATVDFDPGAGTTNLTSITTGVGGYITKLDASGNFLWAVNLPGGGEAISTDALGNVYVTGLFYGTQDFDPGSGTLNLTTASANASDAYVCKFDNNGNFIWAINFGGADAEIPTSMSNDAAGNIIITGNFRATVDFDPGTAVYNLGSSGSTDGFILKLNNNGNFLWACKFGSQYSGEGANDAATDAAGNIYATGCFSGTVDFDPGTGIANMSTNNLIAYIVKLDASGAYQWAKSFGNLMDEGHSIDVDAANNVYVGGVFALTVDFDPSPTATYTITSLNNSPDCFISKFDASGNFIFARQIGSPAYDNLKDLKVSASGNIYYIGAYSGTADFDPAPTTYTMASAGYTDSFIAALNPLGNFLWAAGLEPTAYDYNEGLAVNSNDEVYVSGSFLFQTDFDPGAGIYNLSGVGGNDIFVMKLSTTAAGINEYQQLNSNISVFPNPFTDHITLKTKQQPFKNTTLMVCDVNGSEVKKEEGIWGESITINMNALPKGIYFYRLTQQSRIIASGKLIAQ